MAAPEQEPGGQRPAGLGQGGESPPASPPAAAMGDGPLAWSPASAQAASLLEEAAELLVLQRDFAAALERCEAGCGSLGPAPGPDRCEPSGLRAVVGRFLCWELRGLSVGRKRADAGSAFS